LLRQNNDILLLNLWLEGSSCSWRWLALLLLLVRSSTS
jgi:hypothetical protein